MKMTRTRILSLVLALVMVFSMFPATVLAAEATETSKVDVQLPWDLSSQTSAEAVGFVKEGGWAYWTGTRIHMSGRSANLLSPVMNGEYKVSFDVIFDEGFCEQEGDSGKGRGLFLHPIRESTVNEGNNYRISLNPASGIHIFNDGGSTDATVDMITEVTGTYPESFEHGVHYMVFVEKGDNQVTVSITQPATETTEAKSWTFTHAADFIGDADAEAKFFFQVYGHEAPNAGLGFYLSNINFFKKAEVVGAPIVLRDRTKYDIPAFEFVGGAFEDGAIPALTAPTGSATYVRHSSDIVYMSATAQIQATMGHEFSGQNLLHPEVIALGDGGYKTWVNATAGDCKIQIPVTVYPHYIVETSASTQRAYYDFNRINDYDSMKAKEGENAVVRLNNASVALRSDMEFGTLKGTGTMKWSYVKTVPNGKTVTYDGVQLSAVGTGGAWHYVGGETAPAEGETPATMHITNGADVTSGYLWPRSSNIIIDEGSKLTIVERLTATGTAAVPAVMIVDDAEVIITKGNATEFGSYGGYTPTELHLRNGAVFTVTDAVTSRFMLGASSKLCIDSTSQMILDNIDEAGHGGIRMPKNSDGEVAEIILDGSELEPGEEWTYIRMKSTDGLWADYSPVIDTIKMTEDTPDDVKVVYYTSGDEDPAYPCEIKLVRAAAHVCEYTEEITTAATCTTPGVKTFTCTCGNSYTEEYTDENAHKWIEGEIVDGMRQYTCEYNAEHTKTEAVAYVAQVGETGYETLAEAVEAAEAGETVTLLTAAALTEQLVIDKALTLEMGGFNVDSAFVMAENGSAICVTTGGDLTIAGNGSFTASKGGVTGSANIEAINGGNITVTGTISLDFGINAQNGNEDDYSEVIVDGGSITAKSDTNREIGNNSRLVLKNGAVFTAEKRLTGVSNHFYVSGNGEICVDTSSQFILNKTDALLKMDVDAKVYVSDAGNLKPGEQAPVVKIKNGGFYVTDATANHIVRPDQLDYAIPEADGYYRVLTMTRKALITWRSAHIEDLVEVYKHESAIGAPNTTRGFFEDEDYTYTLTGWEAEDGTVYGLEETLPVATADTTYTAVYAQTEKVKVAEVNGTQYATLAEAAEAANGATVKLIADAAEAQTIDGTLNLDFNGFKITGATTVNAGATLNILSNGELDVLNIYGVVNVADYDVVLNGILTMKGAAGAKAALNLKNSQVTLKKLITSKDNPGESEMLEYAVLKLENSIFYIDAPELETSFNVGPNCDLYFDATSKLDIHTQRSLRMATDGTVSIYVNTNGMPAGRTALIATTYHGFPINSLADFQAALEPWNCDFTAQNYNGDQVEIAKFGATTLKDGETVTGYTLDMLCRPALLWQSEYHEDYYEVYSWGATSVGAPNWSRRRAEVDGKVYVLTGWTDKNGKFYDLEATFPVESATYTAVFSDPMDPCVEHIEDEPIRQNEKDLPPTCTIGGSYEEVILCSVCKAELSRTPVEVPAAGHKPVTDEDGNTTCSECGEPCDPAPEPTTYTVTFESNGGTAVTAQTVTEGETATAPTAPTYEGYTFIGWYSDEALTAEYDFATAVNTDITLYAKWEEVVVEPVEPAVKYSAGQTVQIKLIEPWGLKANARIYVSGQGRYIDYNTLHDYGVYFIRASELDQEGLTQATITPEDIINDADAVHYSKGEGIEVAQYGSDKVLTAIYDKDLYTYEFSDAVFVLFYVVGNEGEAIQYLPIRERILSSLVNSRMNDTSGDFSELEKEVYKYMSELEINITNYRADFNPTDIEIVEKTVPTLSEKALGVATQGGGYGFGHTVQIKLIEPWGMRANGRVYTAGNRYIDYSVLSEYGAVIWYDGENAMNGADISMEELMNKADALVYSSTEGNASINTYGGDEVIRAEHDQGIYTYQLNTNAYVMFYVKDAEGNYHYGPVKTRNLYDLMVARKDDTSGDFSEKERAVYASMVSLHDAVTNYREDYFNKQ